MTARQRAWADSTSLNTIARAAAGLPAPRVTLVRALDRGERRLDGVRGSQVDPVLGREAVERQHALPVVGDLRRTAPSPRGASTRGRRPTDAAAPAHRHARATPLRAGHAGVHNRPGCRPDSAVGGQGPLRTAVTGMGQRRLPGHLVDWSATQLGIDVGVVRRSDGIRGFEVLPRRWVLERTSAWCLRSRRLVRDYERCTDTSEVVVLWSMTMLMSRHLAARQRQRLSPAAAA